MLKLPFINRNRTGYQHPSSRSVRCLCLTTGRSTCFSLSCDVADLVKDFSWFSQPVVGMVYSWYIPSLCDGSKPCICIIYKALGLKYYVRSIQYSFATAHGDPGPRWALPTFRGFKLQILVNFTMRASHVQGKQPHVQKKITGWMEAWWMRFSSWLSIYHSWFSWEYGWIRRPCIEECFCCSTNWPAHIKSDKTSWKRRFLRKKCWYKLGGGTFLQILSMNRTASDKFRYLQVDRHGSFGSKRRPRALLWLPSALRFSLVPGECSQRWWQSFFNKRLERIWIFNDVECSVLKGSALVRSTCKRNCHRHQIIWIEIEMTSFSTTSPGSELHLRQLTF